MRAWAEKVVLRDLPKPYRRGSLRSMGTSQDGPSPQPRTDAGAAADASAHADGSTHAGGSAQAGGSSCAEAGTAADTADRLIERVRTVHRHFPTGVTIVTTTVDRIPYGLAVNAFASLSLKPPLVLVCVSSTSSTYQRLLETNIFAVNILAHDQEPIARRFAQSGGDKFKDFAWRAGTHGAPVLHGVSAHLELRVQQRIPAGTHTIFIGVILEAIPNNRPPLVYLDGSFFDGTALSAPPSGL